MFIQGNKIDQAGFEILFKARCNLRVDLQKHFEDFYPDGLFAPVAVIQWKLGIFQP